MAQSQGCLPVLAVAGSSDEAVRVSVGGLGLESPPCGPPQVTGLCPYMEAGFQEGGHRSCQNFIMLGLRIPRMSLPLYSIGQS